MLQTVNAFVEPRNIDRRTVITYIKRHADLAAAFPLVKGERMLDTEKPEYQVLLDKYPMPKPVIYEDTPATKAELVSLRNDNAMLREMLNQLQKDRMDVLMLADKIEKYDSMKEQLETATEKLQTAEDQRRILDQENNKLKDDIAAMGAQATEDAARIQAAEQSAAAEKQRADEAIKTLEDFQKLNAWQRLFYKKK